MSEIKPVFKTLKEIDVNEHVTQKKSGKTSLSYLSWSWAWSELKKNYPDAEYEIEKFENNLPYVYDENTGYMVFTKVTIGELTHEMWLPVMDGANKAMKSKAYSYETKFNGKKNVEAATMFDINKTIMRCLVKNLAMFGLGLYIYAGEDLPDVEPEPPKPITQENVNKISTMIKSIDELTGTDTTLAYVLKKYQIKSLSDMADNNAKLVLDFVVMLHEKAVEKVEQEKTND